MTLKNVKPSLTKITKSLAATQDSREFLLKNTREIIILCSKSIIAVHKGDLVTAKNNFLNQQNSDDCGVFVLIALETILTNSEVIVT